MYQLGKLNQKPNILIQQLQDLPANALDKRIMN